MPVASVGRFDIYPPQHFLRVLQDAGVLEAYLDHPAVEPLHVEFSRLSEEKGSHSAQERVASPKRNRDMLIVNLSMRN